MKKDFILRKAGTVLRTMYDLGKTLLKLDSVSLSFGSNLILRDINLEIKDIVRSGGTTGQVVTLIGESGIGKSQLMKMIAGLQDPTSGTVLIGESQVPTKAGLVGLVDQKYPLFLHRTLMSNLKLISKDKEKIDTYLNEFNLYEHKDKYPAQLSGGQRQRSAIVQQLLCSENFMLLDEPFSGLDLKAVDKLCGIIEKVAKLNEFNTVIISSHIFEPALALSDHAWILGYEYTTEVTEEGLTTTKVPGAVIREKFDLAAQGLSWRPDLRFDSDFISFVKEVEKKFKSI